MQLLKLLFEVVSAACRSVNDVHVLVMGPLADAPKSTRDQTILGLGALLQKVDPEALSDTVKGFKALQGVRLNKTFKLLSSPGTLPLMWVLAAVLGFVGVPQALRERRVPKKADVRVVTRKR